jgi:predicted Zn-dependent peptidase
LENYITYQLSNRLKIIHFLQESQVAYCGIMIDVGSRDEISSEYGISHLVEHMLFKGTKKRRSSQIINRMEDVGGELNAYTTKEETVLYATFLENHTERTIELIADVFHNSTFPQHELEKEIEVIKDEIQSYNDSPSEQIFDDFEELIYNGNSMAHNVLGTIETLDTITTEKINNFYKRFYQPSNAVFFFIGKTPQKKIEKWVDKYFNFPENDFEIHQRITPTPSFNSNKQINRQVYQTHCIIGAPAFDIYHNEKRALFLLNNILGGPGMNSLLNLSLREKNGLVYNVESTLQTFTDSGWWGIYFGTDAENLKQCIKLVKKQLSNLSEELITEKRLKKYKQQFLGQMIIYSENKESVALGLAKSYMRFGKIDSIDEIKAEIESIRSEKIREIAEELFDPSKTSTLTYL